MCALRANADYAHDEMNAEVTVGVRAGDPQRGTGEVGRGSENWVGPSKVNTEVDTEVDTRARRGYKAFLCINACNHFATTLQPLST